MIVKVAFEYTVGRSTTTRSNTVLVHLDGDVEAAMRHRIAEKLSKSGRGDVNKITITSIDPLNNAVMYLKDY